MRCPRRVVATSWGHEMAVSRVNDAEWTAYQSTKFKNALATEPNPLEPHYIAAEQDNFRQGIQALPDPIEEHRVRQEQDAFTTAAAAKNPLDDFAATQEAEQFKGSV